MIKLPPPLGVMNTPKTSTENHRNEFPGEISKRGTSSPITRTGSGINPAAGLEKEMGLGEGDWLNPPEVCRAEGEPLNLPLGPEQLWSPWVTALIPPLLPCAW